ncbi:short-chain dehydrogenase TIC 32, chloroplastic [Chaetomidium leptoderma]|uniref:Short-chain dehydrogenase TIC 32, chloroplastic n=1 Tax=Chaetomidium leptoderma TaxID=669021 RepID=A0AAN6ZUK2_9PEZI|nr:short-chain dehydrogenase TIC 32, chloroplastic [Chaetomidium leptoderma]
MPAQYNAQTTGSELVQELVSKIKGKVILTTGVSPGGLGAHFVEAVAAANPALLILAGRNTTKVQQTANGLAKSHPGVKTRLLRLDLGSLTAVREAAAEVNSWDDVPAIDVLVNNAAIMAVEYAVTPDGFESQFGTNHLGHFLFTNLVMGRLLAADHPRVVSVSSDGHRVSPVRFDDLDFHGGENYNKWQAYGQSKSANILMALSLAEKLKGRGLRAFSLHPGVIGTNLGAHIDWNDDMPSLRATDRAMGNREGWGEFKFKNNDQGIATHVFAAFHPSLEDHNGAYLQDAHVADPWTETVKSWVTSTVEAERTWKLSEKLVGQEFLY